MILGIDEVGRGPWAGPLVVGAVVLPEGLELDGLTDSKRLSAKRRNELDVAIREKALGWGLGWVQADELDEIGLSEALRLATIRAVEAVNAPYHEIIIDGTINFLKETNKGRFVTTMAKADLLVPAVSAASIIAKVARDAFMEAQDEHYPEYGFGSHVGYGTARHRATLDAHGVTPLHRRSFAPIKKLLAMKDTPEVQAAHRSNQTTKQAGDAAEGKVADYLETLGYTVLERNWKTKHCEIDIIALKDDTYYFVEVKYRRSEAQGGAMAALTAKKIQQMRFAAELYTARHADIHAMRLMAATVNAKGAIDLLAVE